MSESTDHAKAINGVVHRLRSHLARVRAEVELLEMDGAEILHLNEGVTAALKCVSEIERWLATQKEPAPPAGNVVVVVIDDDRRLAELTAARLTSRGISSTFGHDLGKVSEVPQHSVIIVDLGVVLMATEEQRMQLRLHPFIIVTGLVNPDVTEHAATAGAAAVLIKPVSFRELMEAITAARVESA